MEYKTIASTRLVEGLAAAQVLCFWENWGSTSDCSKRYVMVKTITLWA
jgi:hypothetical protein